MAQHEYKTMVKQSITFPHYWLEDSGSEQPDEKYKTSFLVRRSSMWGAPPYTSLMKALMHTISYKIILYYEKLKHMTG